MCPDLWAFPIILSAHYRPPFLPDAPGGFMLNKPLKRRHGDAGVAEFAASSGISAACENGGRRP
jgi:hypothetical protein